MTHWSSAREAPSEAPIAGLATATMVPSSATIITPKAMATRVAQGLLVKPPLLRSGGAVGADGGEACVVMFSPEESRYRLGEIMSATDT